MPAPADDSPRTRSRRTRRSWIVLTVAGLIASGGVPSASAATASPAPGQAAHRFGGLIPTPGTLQPHAAPRLGFGGAAPHVLPPSVDLSTWAQPVGDQGDNGSCLSWAAGYGLLGFYANKQTRTGAPFAPMYVYSQIQATHGGADNGSTMPETMNILVGQGIDTKANYLPQGDFDWHSQPTAAQRVSAAQHKGVAWQSLYNTYPYSAGSGAQAVLQNELAAGNPVVLAIPAYDSFMQLTSGNSFYDVASATGAWGGHAVLAVGYDATGVLIQNSWGTQWGASGYARLSWAFIAQRSFEAADMPSGLAGPPLPTISSVSPAAGAPAGGTVVAVAGSGFTGASAVAFGATPATFSVTSDSQIVATAPPGAGAVNVTVRTANGLSVGGSSTFTYVGSPTVSSVAPVSGPVAGGTVITVTGSSFTGTSQVTVGGAPATFQLSSPTTLLVTAPAHPAGQVEVRVTNASGSSAAGTAMFRYLGPPVVAAASPAGGATAGGTSVLLTGSGFLDASAVTFGATPAMSFAVESDTQLVAVSPPGIAGTSVTLTVTTPSGVSLAGAAFTYGEAPTLSRVSAAAGPVAGATRVTLTGTGFEAGMTVAFGASAAGSVAVLSPTTARVTVPAHVAGAVTVAVNTAGGRAALPRGYRFVAKPLLSSIASPHAPAKGGRWITMYGTALTGAKVTFGAVKAPSVVVVSSRTIRVLTPAHAVGAVSVTVTTVGGVFRKRAAFVFTRI